MRFAGFGLVTAGFGFIVGSVEAVACLLVGDSAFESIVTQEWHKTTLEHTSMLLPPYDLSSRWRQYEFSLETEKRDISTHIACNGQTETCRWWLLQNQSWYQSCGTFFLNCRVFCFVRTLSKLLAGEVVGNADP